MKKRIPKLRVGDQIQAVIIEMIAQDTLIVSIGEDLLRVQNSSAKRFKVGQTVPLLVTSILPMGFRLLDQPNRVSHSIST